MAVAGWRSSALTRLYQQTAELIAGITGEDLAAATAAAKASGKKKKTTIRVVGKSLRARCSNRVADGPKGAESMTSDDVKDDEEAHKHKKKSKK